jgi:carotenoid 1,2-hydratase
MNGNGNGNGNAIVRATETVGGYAWWYFDALSPSGDGLVCIFFIGSVFSPSYAARLRRGERALPTEHPAVNLALYRRGRPLAWVMSEYRSATFTPDGPVHIATSSIEPHAGGWRITLAERAAPYRQRIAGTITVEPLAPPMAPAQIAEAGAIHAWRVLTPRARVRARFTAPAFELDAPGYHDRNWGDGRLEDAFSRWGWARFHGETSTSVVYSFVDRAGRRRALTAHATDADPGAPVEAPPLAELAPRRIAWGMEIPSQFGVANMSVEPTSLLEQAPFYARYRARLAGGPDVSEGMGEWLDLDKFRSRWNQFLLRFKTRRP